MKKLFPAVIAIGLLASGAAFAQTAPASSTGPAAGGGSSTNPVSATTPDSNRAGNTNDANNGTTAAPGGGLTHNNNDPAAAAMSDTGTMSYTESDARGRFNSEGYTSVTGLSKDDGSMWHAKAIKDGKWVQVTLDTHGNVMSE